MERQITTGKLLATQGYVIGVEISGSGSRQSVALADLDGNILYKARRPLEYVPDTQTVLRLLDEMLAEVTAPERLRDGRILRAGVAVGGLVDSSQGVVRTMHHAQGWDNFPLQDYLVEKLDVPCIIDNNANAAALAEVESGAASPSGEEGGHKKAERITAEQVFQLAAGGDPIAQRVIEDVYTYLGIAIANIVYLINPGLIVLGGQVALAGELLIAPLQARVDDLCLPVVGQSVRIVQSKHGSEANIVGAVTLALQDV